MFYPSEPVERKHDAVYTASMRPLKRFALAREVKSLALIVYRLKRFDEDYYHSVKEQLSHAHWMNDIGNSIPPPRKPINVVKAGYGYGIPGISSEKCFIVFCCTLVTSV